MPGYSLDFWRTLFPCLDLWRSLSPKQRHAAARLGPDFQDVTPVFATLYPDLSDALLETNASGRHRPRPGLGQLLGFLQQIAGWTLDDSVDATLQVQQLTTRDQRLALTGLRSGTSNEVITKTLVGRMQEGWFAKTLLASDSPGYYLAALSGWLPEGQAYEEAHHVALRSWLARIRETGPGPKPLAAETFRVPGSEVPPEELIHLLLNHGLLLLSLAPVSLEPMIQVPFASLAVRQGPENLVLRPFAGRRNSARPFLMDDMDACLRAIRADPAPLLGDGVNLSVAHQRKMARSFLALPFEAPGPGWEGEWRAAAAWWMIGSLGLVSVTGRGRKTLKGMRASINPQGEAWLKLAREKKLEQLLREVPCGRRKAHPVATRFSWLGDFAAYSFPYAALSAGIFEGMDEAFVRLEMPVEFNSWIRSAAEGFNPMIAAAERDPDLDDRWKRWDEPPKSVYARLMHHQAARLASLGALVLSIDADGRLGLSLSGVGRWLFGLGESWTYPEEGRPIAVVGGDFTITLLEASPGLESDLGAFADPVNETGRAGTAFKITRPSVLKGVHAGLTPEVMLETLKLWAKNALPGNVIHEIGAWAGSGRRLILRDSLQLECEDPIRLAELFSLFPKEFERVAPTILKYIGKGTREGLAKRLGKKGFFTD